ncbi:MAG: T9SS type A sorting domain-containing protein [Saprospiraceae bacterium]|nr:T9SS type A sorting domain-containing protein [Saprospiraceae bacterium]
MSSVYPNPFTSHCSISLQVKAQNDCRIVLTDIAGKTVYSSINTILQPGTYIFPLDVDLSTGTYIVTIYVGSNLFTHKLIKL